MPPANGGPRRDKHTCNGDWRWNELFAGGMETYADVKADGEVLLKVFAERNGRTEEVAQGKGHNFTVKWYVETSDHCQLSMRSFENRIVEFTIDYY